MSDCPSCREPLDYPSGDGCAVMTMHKEKPMSDYKIVSSDLTDRFTAMLNDYKNDFEEEIVVVSLMKYYDLCSKPTKVYNTVDEWIDPDEDLLWAIERVLQDYMTTSDFDSWVSTRGYPKR